MESGCLLSVFLPFSAHFPCTSAQKIFAWVPLYVFCTFSFLLHFLYTTKQEKTVFPAQFFAEIFLSLGFLCNQADGKVIRGITILACVIRQNLYSISASFTLAWTLLQKIWCCIDFKS